MSSYNILFYSNNCKLSQEFLVLMKNEKLDKYFYFICIDDNKIPQIKYTPTLIIKGIHTPYVAGDAFVWLSKIKQWKINMTLQKLSSAQQEYLKTINNNLMINANNNNIISFSKNEMEGMTDLFAYIQEDSAIPHSYFDYNDIGKEYILTPPLENGQYKINSDNKYRLDILKSQELKSKLEMERKKQDEIFKNHIDNFKEQYNK